VASAILFPRSRHAKLKKPGDMMRKLIAPLLTLLLVLGLGAGIYVSVNEQLAKQSTVTVRGLIGSEKEDFFRDPRVIEALAKQGLAVELEKAGSRQIATQFKLKDYDFAFPSGAPAAEKIKREANVNKAYEVFFTPMAVASWKLIAGILEANGIVSQRDGVYYIIDLTRLLQFVTAEKRWSDLGKNEGYNVKKSLLVGTTDVRQSNSAAMYLSLASYILNNNNIVDSAAQIGPIIQPLESLFLRQGFVENSSASPFKDYLVMGAGKAPLLMIYEAQYLEEASRANSGVSNAMALLYPEPTIFTKHILVPFNDKGDRLGTALADDPELQKLAIEHGFRNRDAAGFRDFVKSHRLEVPDTLVNVVEPPTFEILEQMIVMIEQRYKGN
jgi:hypothetical protein